MERVLEEFITAARVAGVRISISETLDAARALELVGYGDRALLRDALAVSLAKTAPEKELLQACFERFFAFDFFAGGAEADGCAPPEAPLPDVESPLLRLLMEEDRAGLAAAMTEAARLENLSQIRYFTQRSLFAFRLLDRMGAGELDRQLQALRAVDTPAATAAAARLEAAKNYLADNVRRYVQNRYDLFAGDEGVRRLDGELRLVKLSNIEQRHFARIHQIIQRMVKRLNDLHSRRRKRARRGVLDFKRTLRENISCQGLLFTPSWKRKKVDRPQFVVICDISRSVLRTVRFLLLFLYGLNQEIARIRTFVFCTNLVEVSDILDSCPVDEALTRIQGGTDIPLIMGRTDYERSFGDFRRHYLHAVTRKTTVLILGDARNNYNDPCPEHLKAIYDRGRRLIWLNPEVPAFWGAGDSEIKKYSPYCTVVRECNTLDHIERLIGALIRT
ncbi:MAG TPA: VWA domain-containing protein [Syntrophales bacterium]|nr:VWA domain-containing protein [Syntrophales bacterium]HON23046.1 VWA domain-containing protein [Syntrophales bacterium]HOU77746.1 VWA domain-containing protein [Syntrophales bacterium]HPC32845.1 VWA domain-containing protein [Syntrophales bacterium]HQG34877.1 VWA domain-containing protein [Syntrophales bacterium]